MSNSKFLEGTLKKEKRKMVDGLVALGVMIFILLGFQLAIRFVISIKAKRLFDGGEFIKTLDPVDYSSYRAPIGNRYYDDPDIQLITTEWLAPYAPRVIRIESGYDFVEVVRGQRIEVAFLSRGKYKNWQITASIVEDKLQLYYRKLP